MMENRDEVLSSLCPETTWGRILALALFPALALRTVICCVETASISILLLDFQLCLLVPWWNSYRELFRISTIQSSQSSSSRFCLALGSFQRGTRVLSIEKGCSEMIHRHFSRFQLGGKRVVKMRYHIPSALHWLVCSACMCLPHSFWR